MRALLAWFKNKVGTVDNEGWCIKRKHFVFHPHSYGIATLMRIGFRTRPGGYQLHLHHFRPHVARDEDDYHDHPWDFRTFVLWGSYLDEHVIGEAQEIAGQQVWAVTSELMKPGMTRKRLATHAHKTSSETGAVTLVFTWPKERTWCSGTPENWLCGGEVTDFDETRGLVKVETEWVPGDD